MIDSSRADFKDYPISINVLTKERIKQDFRQWEKDIRTATEIQTHIDFYVATFDDSSTFLVCHISDSSDTERLKKSITIFNYLTLVKCEVEYTNVIGMLRFAPPKQ